MTSRNGLALVHCHTQSLARSSLGRVWPWHEYYQDAQGAAAGSCWLIVLLLEVFLL